MITSLRLGNFKNFTDETLKLGPFTVIVGANASGKSNIRDAFRFLHGIGRGYTLDEILGGKYGAGGYLEWEPIRGAPSGILQFEKEGYYSRTQFSLDIEVEDAAHKTFYTVAVYSDRHGRRGFRMEKEELRIETQKIYSSRETYGTRFQIEVGNNAQAVYTLNQSQPALTQFIGNQHIWDMLGIAVDLPEVLAKARFPELDTGLMREPSIPGATILGDYGQNLASVLYAISAYPRRKEAILSWLQELTPMEVTDFTFVRDPSGRLHLQIVEGNGQTVTAYSASDGTMRFLAILAMLLNEEAGGIYFFEDIDNGIHPSRLRLLLELIENQTAKGKIQVITTTHSPALLAWMNDTTFEHTSVVYRDQYWTHSVIRPVAELPHLQDLRQSQGLEGLFTTGWLETVMHFSEGDPDTDHQPDDEDGSEENSDTEPDVDQTEDDEAGEGRRA